MTDKEGDLVMKKGVVAVLSMVTGALVGAGAAAKQTSKKANKQKEYADKHLALYLLMNQWVKVKQENKSIEEYCLKKGYREIAIYGMNYVGETLLNELSGSEVKVKYGIDRNAGGIYADISVITPDDKMPEVDAVIVTPITFFDEIEGLLSQRIDCPIISIEDILYEI